MNALVIAGHGSHLSARSSEPVYRHADAIRQRGVFDEVRECFWKEEPPLSRMLELVESDQLFVVPLFVSQGYFTREVIPRELGLDGPAPSVTRKAGKTVHYCGPIGTHPWMTEMILRRAEETAGLSERESKETALIVIGHGTERNAGSSGVILRVADEARRAGVFASVEPGFLDQSPEVGEVLERVKERRVVLVPFFVAEGWHTQETIPDGLGIHRPGVSSVSEKDGRVIHYAAPVGTFPEVADIVVQRAREAGAKLAEPGSDAHRTGGGGMAAAREALLEWIGEAGRRNFLQVEISCLGKDRYQVRHRDDSGFASQALDSSSDPCAARRIAQSDEKGEHRPLKTSPTLRRGWVLTGLDGSGLGTALDYLYPGCALHWHQGREGAVRTTSWRETAARQSGIHASVRLLEEGALRDAVEACCAPEVCLRAVQWGVEEGAPPVAGGEGEAGSQAEVPCPEACSMFISLARAVLAVERGERGAGATPGEAREGDFGNPANRRRRRYLAARRAVTP